MIDTAKTTKEPVIRVEAPRVPAKLSARAWKRHAGEMHQMNQELGKIVGLCLSDMKQIAEMVHALRWYRPWEWRILLRAIVAKAEAYNQQEIPHERQESVEEEATDVCPD